MSKKQALKQHVDTLIEKAKALNAKRELQLQQSIDELVNPIYDNVELSLMNRISSRKQCVQY